MTLRILLCDDEPIAVARMSALLARIPGCEVVGTALDGEAVLGEVTRLSPDLLFLDVEMPGPDGFEALQHLSREAEQRGRKPPIVVFVTAFRRVAADAFDSGAVDFLTKPVRLERLRQCVQRAARQLEARAAIDRLIELEGRVEELEAEHAAGASPQIWVQRRGGRVRVRLWEIERAEADGPYVRLFVHGTEYLHRETIAGVEAQLGPRFHLRVHRCHLVRRSCIEGVRRTRHGGSELVLRGGTTVPVGRSYAKDVRRQLFGPPYAAAARGSESRPDLAAGEVCG